LWTSGVPNVANGKKRANFTKVTWCSTKTVTKLSYTLPKPKKTVPQCVGMDIKQKKLIAADCNNKGIVFCEVIRKCIIELRFVIYRIRSLFAKNQTARTNMRVAKMYFLIIFNSITVSLFFN